MALSLGGSSVARSLIYRGGGSFAISEISRCVVTHAKTEYPEFYSF